MEVEIVLRGRLQVSDSSELEALADLLRVEGMSIDRATVSVPGVKSEGLTIGLAVAGLIVSSISAAVAVLSYWSSTRPQYSVRIQDGEVEYFLDGLSRSEMLELSKKLSGSSRKRLLLVRVSRKSR